MKYYETKEFLKLQRIWKKKLKASEFKDIERNEHQLSMYSYQVFQSYSPFIQDYYSKALDFLHTFSFNSDLDRFIWSNHAAGLSCRDISTLLKASTTYLPLEKTAVHDRIRAIEALMLKEPV